MPPSMLRVGVNLLFLIPRKVGGTEQHSESLIRALAAADPRLELVVFVGREAAPSVARWAEERIHIRPCAVDAESRPARVLFEQTSLPLLARREGVAVLHSMGYTAPLFTGLPSVLTLYDMNFVNHPEDNSWLANLGYRLLVPPAARRASAVVTVSEFSAGEIVRHLGVPRHKIHVIPGGPCMDLPPAASLAKRSRPPELEGRPYVVTVAAAYPHKNHARWLSVYDRLRDRGLPHRLVLAGTHVSTCPSLARQCADLRHSADVVRLEWLAPEELAVLIDDADALVLPSLYEGLGLPLLEAMRYGTPIACSRRASMPEVAGDAAVYFDPENEEEMMEVIAHLLEDQDLRKALGAAGLARATRFDWSDSARIVARIYRMVAAPSAV